MSWTFGPLASDINYMVSAKLGTDTVANGGGLKDADVGKPVKLLSAGIYGLCSDGDNIDGFLAAVNPETVDGYTFGTVQIGGRVYAELDGAATFGDVVEAGTMAAAGTAEANGYGIVSSHAGLALTDTNTVDEALPLIKSKKWKIISGAVTDEAIVLLECVN